MTASVFDIVIIGAGAAGIGAARAIVGADPDLSCLIIEARARIGGRAHTIHSDAMALDLGCGWLHSADRNSWTRVAEERGRRIDRTAPPWGRQYRDLGFSSAEQHEASRAHERFATRMRTDPPASDRAADLLDADDRWAAYFEARSGYVNGASLDRVSVRDYLAYDDAATDENWRLPDGYGALIASVLPTIPVSLANPLRAIREDGAQLRLATAGGDVRARAVILTVPTAIMASGSIAMPASLDEHRHAAACLPLGLADKLFLALDDADAVDADVQVIGSPHRAETGSYHLRPFGRPIIEAFYGGRGAESLEVAGLDGMAAFAIDELVGLFGSAWRRRLRLLTGSRWKADGYAQGSYSHALPGHAAARATLRHPALDDRLFFAGEATSLSDFSTAHGAYDSGVRAAGEAMRALRSRPDPVRHQPADPAPPANRRRSP